VFISATFYEQLLRRYSFAKKLQNQTVIREKLLEGLSHKKIVCKMLLKMTTGRSLFRRELCEPSTTFNKPKPLL